MPGPDDPQTPEQAFLAQLPFIKKVIASSVRKYRLSPEDAEDFASTVNLKLISDDYGVFRKFQGDSKLSTYLAVVIQRALKDHIDHLWGKFRESAEAMRLGPVAKQLDELINREGYTVDEACQILKTNRKVQESLQELSEMAARLPARMGRRRAEGEERLEALADPHRTDERVEARERQARLKRALDILKRVIATRPPEDRLLLDLLKRGVKPVQMVPMLGVEQKKVYRRRDQLFGTLRKELEREGIRAEDVREILAGLA